MTWTLHSKMEMYPGAPCRFWRPDFFASQRPYTREAPPVQTASLEQLDASAGRGYIKGEETRRCEPAGRPRPVCDGASRDALGNAHIAYSRFPVPINWYVFRS